MFHKIKKVTALPGYKLAVLFEDESQKEYDVNPLFGIWSAFQDLKNIDGLFHQVRVDTGGYGISWNDNIDLSCEELWENGKPIGGGNAKQM